MTKMHIRNSLGFPTKGPIYSLSLCYIDKDSFKTSVMKLIMIQINSINVAISVSLRMLLGCEG